MKLINGDITSLDRGVIIQQVNCQGVMGAGVAKALYTKWPIIKQKYECFSSRSHKEALYGMVQTINVTPQLTVYNSFSQFGYGTQEKQTNESMLINNINMICKAYAGVNAQSGNYIPVYVPYGIGCGLGGGNWALVSYGIADNKNLTLVKL